MTDDERFDAEATERSREAWMNIAHELTRNLAAANARVATLREALEECAAYLKVQGGPGAPYITVAEALAQTEEETE